MEFILIENNITTKYKYFGEIQVLGGMDLGIDIAYPDKMEKKGWYSTLLNESECMAAATLCYLYQHSLIEEPLFNESYGELDSILSSKLFTDFMDKFFEDGVFSEPYFIDGSFGRFSNYGELSYSENDESDESFEFTWLNRSIRMIYGKKCFYGDWKGKIFNNPKIENEFKTSLKVIIEMFNTEV